MLRFSKSEKYFAKIYKGKPMIGDTYRKSRFFEYDSIDYRNRKGRTIRERHMGLLGPVIRAEVGDKVEVALLNLTPHPVSLVFQGVSVTSDHSGARMKNLNGRHFCTFMENVHI